MTIRLINDNEELQVGDTVSRRGDGDLWTVIVPGRAVTVRCINPSPGSDWCKVGQVEVFMHDRLDLE